MEDIIAVSIPICVCVVLPVMIVWLVQRSRSHKIDRRTEVLVKAIENGVDVDPNLLIDETPVRRKSLKMQMISYLSNGVIFGLIGLLFIVLTLAGVASFPAWGYYAGIPLLAVGLGNLVAYFVGVRYMAPEIKAEEGAKKE